MKQGDKCPRLRCSGKIIIASGAITKQKHYKCNKCEYSYPITEIVDNLKLI